MQQTESNLKTALNFEAWHYDDTMYFDCNSLEAWHYDDSMKYFF